MLTIVVYSFIRKHLVVLLYLFILLGSMNSDPLILGRVIGDVIDYFTASIKMSVIYNNKEIFTGYEVPFPSTVKTKPRIQIQGGDMRSLFTLVLTIYISCTFFICV